MAEVKKFKARITSEIEPVSGDTEYTESVIDSRVAYMSSGSVIINYEEDSEGGKILSDIRISLGEVTVSRRGAIVSTLVFREGERYAGLYSVPPISFDIEIFCRKIRNNVTESGGSLLLVYDMTIGADKRRQTLRIELT